MMGRVHLKGKYDDFWDYVKSSSSPKAPSGQTERPSESVKDRLHLKENVHPDDFWDYISSSSDSATKKKTENNLKMAHFTMGFLGAVVVQLFNFAVKYFISSN